MSSRSYLQITPLHLAAYRCDAPVIALLIEANADATALCSVSPEFQSESDLPTRNGVLAADLPDV